MALPRPASAGALQANQGRPEPDSAEDGERKGGLCSAAVAGPDLDLQANLDHHLRESGLQLRYDRRHARWIVAWANMQFLGRLLVESQLLHSVRPNPGVSTTTKMQGELRTHKTLLRLMTGCSGRRRFRRPGHFREGPNGNARGVPRRICLRHACAMLYVGSPRPRCLSMPNREGGTQVSSRK